MSDKKGKSSYQRAIDKLAIYENSIKQALEMLDPSMAINQSEFITNATNAKFILINAMMRVANL